MGNGWNSVSRGKRQGNGWNVGPNRVIGRVSSFPLPIYKETGNAIGFPSRFPRNKQETEKKFNIK